MSDSIDKLVHKSRQEQLLSSLSWTIFFEIESELKEMSDSELCEYYHKLYSDDPDKAAEKYNRRLQRRQTHSPQGNTNPTPKTHSVYKLVADNDIVYIGVTNNPTQRATQHRQDKLFNRLIVIEEYDNRDDALIRERELIDTLSPKYNKR